MTLSVDLEAIVDRCSELLERVHNKIVRQVKMEFTLYNVVAFKLFGYALNTFKSIYYLLPHTVYEQASVLYRTLWETDVNLEWIALEPESRAERFLRFTAVEYRNFIKSRIRTARRAKNADAILTLTHQLSTFEKVLEQQLSQFMFTGKSSRQRWRDRFSAPSLHEVVQEVGSVWLDEYDRDYLLGCIYTHGAPSAVLFPLFDTPDHQIDKIQSVERAGIIGAMAIDVMSRIYRRYLAVRGMEDDDFLRQLDRQVREAGRA